MKKSFLSEQAKEFRSKYGIKNSISRNSRAYQKDLIVEEFKEFLEADGFLFKPIEFGTLFIWCYLY